MGVSDEAGAKNDRLANEEQGQGLQVSLRPLGQSVRMSARSHTASRRLGARARRQTTCFQLMERAVWLLVWTNPYKVG